jgi:hypothetical protein
VFFIRCGGKLMMKCPKCGTPQVDNLPFCETCGNPFPLKTKLSKASLIGFLLSIISVIGAVLTVDAFTTAVNNPDDTNLLFGFTVAGFVICVVCFIAGLAVSIIGAVKTRKKKMKGKGFAIAGICISALMCVVTVIFSIIVALGLGLLAVIGSSMSGGLHLGTIYDGPTREFGDYQIRMTSNQKEATVFKWYWSGERGDRFIHFPEYYADDVDITGIGGSTGGPLEPFRIVPADASKDYFASAAYRYSSAYNTNLGPEDGLRLFGIKPGTTVYMKEIVFVVSVGQKINVIYLPDDNNNYLAIANDDGSITFYKCYYYFEVDEYNDEYSSVDGDLYSADGDLIYSYEQPSEEEKVIVVE